MKSIHFLQEKKCTFIILIIMINLSMKFNTTTYTSFVHYDIYILFSSAFIYL